MISKKHSRIFEVKLHLENYVNNNIYGIIIIVIAIWQRQYFEKLFNSVFKVISEIFK